MIKPKDSVLKTEPGVQLVGLLEEGLRERCIFEVLEEKRVKAGQTRDDLHLLFNYMYNVRSSCIDDQGVIRRNCAERTMRQLGIDFDSVHSCITQSFELSDPEGDNWILARDRAL